MDFKVDQLLQLACTVDFEVRLRITSSTWVGRWNLQNMADSLQAAGSSYVLFLCAQELKHNMDLVAHIVGLHPKSRSPRVFNSQPFEMAFVQKIHFKPFSRCCMSSMIHIICQHKH